jgi:cytoskeletal protein CcmA (bactofilin family)
MAVFGSGSGASSDAVTRGQREASLSIIAVGARVVGELKTSGVVKVEGTVEGAVRAEREVLVSKGGSVQGDIYTREAVIGGEVVGCIYAEERVEVQENSVVQGDIITKKLVVQEGGEVNGHVQMGQPTFGESDGEDLEIPSPVETPAP